MVMSVIVSVPMPLAVTLVLFVVVVVIVTVMMSVPAELQSREANAGEDQQAADHRVLCALHRGAKLESDGHDHAAEQERDEHVRDAGDPRQSRDPREAIAARASDDRQRDPVIGQDRVTEADARGGNEQRRGRRAHAGSACSAGRAARPRRRCSVCEMASASSTRTWSSCRA